MDLWTEFEGHTIDSAYSLNKLLQTEGRSAFFSTLNSKGESVLIRLVECHFDEDEILARWRGVQALNHPNFLRIDHYGQFLIEADDITAVYVVFERVDFNLGQVLEKGRLTPADATQIGLSMASALQTLHANGFVHQHLEAANIFAVGETVKLRSDCVRETPEGDRGFEARRRDVRDLAIVLDQVLTGMVRGFTSNGRKPLPAPFEDIVRNGMSGAWGLEEISAALAPPKRPAPQPSPAPAAIPVVAAAAATPEEKKIPIVIAPADDPAPHLNPRQGRASEAAARETPQREFQFSRARTQWDEPEESSHFEKFAEQFRDLRERFQDPRTRGIAAIAMLLVVVLCGWGITHHLMHRHAVDAAAVQPAATAHPAAHSAKLQQKAASTRAAVSRPAPVAQKPGEQWRVVAYTYRHRDQAQQKAAALSGKLPGLSAEAFSPNGKSPWLVTVGGPLEHDAAYSLAHRARSLGLPHDTYAQNFTVR